ncbi:MAG: T9SS type A sorting domain-containing protein, partial [Candidatus Cloacimonetes bacterium]|nr:T9SS type A sorting domain-containing protein [Candidatus Cloacimonadota bacterium]
GNLDSSGDLFRLRFIVNPAAADLQNTDLVISNFQYNNGSPVPIITPGIFTVRNRYDMDGWTQYYSNENPISEVDISATGFSSGSQISDEDGYFNFSQHYYGNYELVPEFIGAVPEIVVSPFDASLIARYALGLETLSSSQISAGNVDGDGDVDIYDAALVARYCVGLIPEFTAGTMIFTPLNHSFLLSPSYTARTFTGIAIGDVSGNWGSTRNDNISPEVAYEQFEDEENLYLKVSYPHPFYSLYSKLFYDPETLEYLSHAFGNGGTDLSALVNSESGLLQLAAYGVTAEPGGENVITFSFRKLTPANGEIGISHIVFDESIGAPTANDDQISPVITNLRQNYPNPFNPSTTISFSLSQAQQVKLDVYNIKGQKVHSLANGGFNAGLHNLTWDAAGFGSGIYFARISTSEGYSKTIKMMLMK